MQQHLSVDFEKLLDCYESKREDLKRYFRGTANANESDADDLTQEVGLQIVRYPPQKEVQQVDHLLWTIAKRVAIGYWLRKKKEHRNNRRLDEAAASDVHGTSGMSDADSVEQDAQQAELQALFSKLPRRQQAVALMRVRGYTLSEIATELETTPDAVRGEFARALLFFSRNPGS